MFGFENVATPSRTAAARSDRPVNDQRSPAARGRLGDLLVEPAEVAEHHEAKLKSSGVIQTK